ncbi:MAG: threonine/serine exporter family protein [Lachnospiraceae bacterium]|nr:threonine/serine exporter family protein [Lachnospiraceae bacterium]
MTEKQSCNSCRDDLHTVIEAGKILMQSGAEIYRIEETMEHMAAALHINDFKAYVVNRGIIASGRNRLDIHEAKVCSVPETSVHLSKIEAVNSLSREIEQQDDLSSTDICRRLQEINDMPDPNLWALLLAYFIGAGCFSYAIGSCLKDSLSSALAGLVMGLLLQWVGKYVKTPVLLTILESAAVTVTANLLCLAGLGENRGLIILGSLMLIIPGAVFTSSIREFSQSNHSTGMTLLMSALLTCLSIAVGVALTTDFLPFATQMTSVFSTNAESFHEILIRTLMAGIGTIAFSFLFHAPKKYFLDLGVLGAASWMIYLLLSTHLEREILTIFFPALFASLCSMFLSVKRRCPMTIFLSTSIFPLIPGLSFYRSVYFLMTGFTTLAVSYMRSCFNSAFAIAVAIIVVQELRSHRIRLFKFFN